MKLALLGAGLGSRTSGQSRFLLNLSRGLRRAAVDVSITAAAIHGETRAELERDGIEAVDLGERPDLPTSQARLVAPGSSLGRRVARAALAREPCDWYVVLADGLLDAIDVLPPDRSVYLSNGDLSLMFLSPTFYRTRRLAKQWVARNLARSVLQNSARARRFHVLLANCEFTRDFMSYLYGVPFQDFVHPPVDLDLFCPAVPSNPGYAVAIARNLNEQGLELLEELAREVRIHVVGGAFVPGTVAFGEVTDAELVRQYSGATVTLSPVVSELFGYSVAESLACGTPVLAFDCGGPAGQVRPGSNGWLVRTRAAFVSTARSIFASGYPSEWRQNARASAAAFGLEASTRRLLQCLEREETGPPSTRPSAAPDGPVRD